MNMKKELLTFFAFATLAAAQTAGSLNGAPQTLTFQDVQNGDLITDGQQLHVALNHVEPGLPLPAVEFFFTSETRGATTAVGTDRTGMVPGFSPACATPLCTIQGVYTLTIGDTFSPFPTGWGLLSARIAGHRNDDAFVRVFLHRAPIDGVFTQPVFQEVVPPGGTVRVQIDSLAENIVSMAAQWLWVEPAGDRNINRYEQHVVGAGLSPNGGASCVPTAIGANLAWLNDTTQWLTIPNSITSACSGSRDYCFVTFLGLLMGTSGSGTSGAGADKGLVAYLNAIGYSKGTDYEFTDESVLTGGVTAPEYLLSRFSNGEVISVGVNNFPGEQGFGHALPLDNILMNADGSAQIRLMDPFTLNNPPTLGIYRWFHMAKDGTLDWNHGVPAPGYGPASGHLRVSSALTISGFHFFNFLPAAIVGNAPSAMSALSTVPQSGPIKLTQAGEHTWVGEFTPPAGSPGPWLLVSQVTLESGHTKTDYRYVLGRSNIN